MIAVSFVSCARCDGPVRLERCVDFHPTRHRTIVALECAICGLRTTVQCHDCEQEANRHE